MFFARTHAFNSMAVASPAVVRTAFDVPAAIERGPSKLIVIALRAQDDEARETEFRHFVADLKVAVTALRAA